MQAHTPIVIDLDDTLARTDFFYETLLVYIKRNPLNFLRALWVLLTQGKSQLKERLCNHVTINPALIPYNQDVLDWAQAKKDAGHQIILATATHISIAQSVSNHLGLFDRVLATDNKVNLKGLAKRDKLVELLGERQFIYAGDSHSDLHVWQAAKAAVVVNPSKHLLQKVESLTQVERVISGQHSAGRFLRVIRLHQWVKNLLVFVPLFTSHNLTNGKLFFQALIAFLAFSLCASAVYIINDLLDLEDDRQHNTKYKRPFASGQVSIITGVLIGFGCLSLSILLSLSIGWAFLWVIVVYVSITSMYSWYLKYVVMLDIVVLSGLYTLRISAGAVAISVELSSWLLVFSVFLFLSLALMKRYTELHGLRANDHGKIKSSRGYYIVDMNLLAVLGSVSGYISILVLALFINNLAVENQYKHPELLWGIFMLLLFWVGRMWLEAHRGNVDEDPISYVIQDKVSWVVGLACLLIFFNAS